MKIGLTGSSLNNKDYLSGSATPTLGFIKELVKHGHQIVWLEKNSDNKITKYSPVPVINATKENISRLPKELELDLVIIQTWCFSPALIAKSFKKSGTKVFYWDDNTPFAMRRLLSAEPYVDKILTHGDGAADILRKFGIPKNKIEIFYFATDPNRFKPKNSSKHRSDVTFVGTNLRERNESLKSIFFNPSQKLKNYSFKLFGSNWNNWKQLNKFQVEYCGWVKNEDLHKVFSNATISINATRATFKNVKRVPSNRIFDTMASGTVLMTDPLPGIEKMFKIGEDILVASNTREATKLMKGIFNNLKKAAFIRKSAREKILHGHCWKHRVQQIGLSK